MVAFAIAVARCCADGGGSTSHVERQRKPRARLNLRDARVLDRELRAFSAEQYANADAYPRRRDLVAAERVDLRLAIERYHGGFRAFRLHSTQRRAPPRTRTALELAGDFSKLSGAIRHFIEMEMVPLDEAHADVTRRCMPTQAAFRLAGRDDLVAAMRAHGGARAVAARMSLHMHYHAWAGADYAQLSELLDALRQYMAAEGEQTLPTMAALRAKGRPDLIAGMRAHGGAVAVARALGVKLGRGTRARARAQTRAKNEGAGEAPRPRRRQRTMLDENFFALECASEAALEENMRKEMAAERGGGGGALLPRDGGRRRSHHHFQDFEVLRAELVGFIFDDGEPGMMPTANELIDAGRRDLVRAMQTHGGQKNVAARLGLACRSMNRKSMAGSPLR